ncbi:hypothetical protein BDR03DRAFT_35203 [Suillus americanus]|nr:hypothetical protein BDR03DRAFT_35203 [Suillus americanus]
MKGSCFHQIPHSFVVAKFLPQRSATWTSYYGLEKAASLKSLPFLALRVSRTDVGMQDFDRQGQFLFAISSKKPTGVNDGCYFTLGSSLDKDKKMLRFEPPLRPGDRTLYVHTFPRLLEDTEFKLSPKKLCLISRIDLTILVTSPSVVRSWKFTSHLFKQKAQRIHSHLVEVIR